MTKTYFLQIIRDHINNEKTVPERVDVEELCLLSIQHQLAPIVYYQTQLPQLASQYYSAISAYANRKCLVDSVIKAFTEYEMSFFQVKGMKILEYYPIPSLRTMGDVDIVVENMKKANDAMFECGFNLEASNDGHEWKYEHKGLEFEIHSALIYEQPINEERITTFLSECWNNVRNNELDINFHFIYILTHLRKHLMNRGVGFRQFLDVALMIKKCDQLNWKWIEQKLDLIGLLDFSKVVFAFVNRWWGVYAPIEIANISDEFYLSATNTIFENGVFGFNNDESLNFRDANEIRAEGRLKRFVHKVFPNYKSLCLENKVLFVKGKPFLLPVAWLYRITKSVVKGNLKNKALAITGSKVTNEYIEKRQEMFRQWGLS